MGRKPQRQRSLIGRACALLERARQLRDAGSPVPALRASQQSLDLFLKHDPRPGPDAANVLLERSGLFLDLSRFHEAAASIEAAVSILEAYPARGPIARLRHQVFIQSGHVHILRAEYRRARRAFSRALTTAEGHGLSDWAVARALNGLGMAARYGRRFAEAARFYHRALRHLGRAAETSGPLMATVLHNLGGLDHARRRFARAEHWARRGLAARERWCGATAVATGTDLAALAAIVHARRRHEEAARLYERALAILRSHLPHDHFEVVFNLAQMAALEQARGRVVTSRRLYRWARPRLEQILGGEHPVVVQVAANATRLEAEIEAEALPGTGRHILVRSWPPKPKRP